MDRRSLFKVLAASLVPVAGLIPGDEENIFIALLFQGCEITERMSVPFRWDTELKLVLGEGHDLLIDGVAAFLAVTGSSPFRVHTFEPIRMTPSTRLEVSWLFAKQTKK